jgi:thioesterase domain-containing protein
LNGTPLRAESVEDLAATYIERVRELYRHGPYVLYGASDGGTIAMEMARQLKHVNEHVPLVILGDSSAPGPHLSARGRHAVRIRELRQLSGWPRLCYFGFLAKRGLVHRARRLGPAGHARRRQERMVTQALERGEAVPVVARTRHVAHELRGPVNRYRPRPPVADRIVLLRTGGAAGFPDRGWSGVAGGALQVIDVPGTHTDLSREASSAYIGPVLVRLLNEVDEHER